MPLLRNLSWLMLAEVFSRLSRLVTLFVLAKCFSNTQYGLAMLALLIHELFRVFTRLGTGAKIIQCENTALHSTLQNAATLQWLVALSIATLQIISAQWIALFYQMPELERLLQIMALAHIFYPIVAIRIFEQHRDNNFRYYGLASGSCIAFENLLVAGLVIFDANVAVVAYAKVSAAICWVALFYRLPSQLQRYEWTWFRQKELIRFSCATLVSELNRMLRFQSDSLIAARLLPADQFGLYSFAKSAGLGIAQSFSQAYCSALYPHLCDRIRQFGSVTRAERTTLRITYAICAAYLSQACLALFYVDWLFGERWQEAAGITALLCIVAIPTLLVDHRAFTLRAMNKPKLEMLLIAFCSSLLAGALLTFRPDNAFEIAAVTLLCSLLWLTALPWRAFSTRKHGNTHTFSNMEAKLS